MTAPIIVTATFGPADFARLDALRRAHFPPERNVLAAHLTLFHHLPPSIEAELLARLKGETHRMPAPAAMLDRVLPLGRGTAFGVRSEGLVAIRARLAEAFADCLVPQDRAGWRPHVTIQNKVDPAEAKRLKESLEQGFIPQPLVIAGLAASHYRGGPWEAIGSYRFTG